MRHFIISLIASALAIAGAAPAAKADGGRDRWGAVEGELRSAASLFAAGTRTPALDRAALAKGLPGGVLAGKKFVLLLVDGRVLGKLYAALPEDANAVRVQGIVHDAGRSMTPERIEYKKSGGWKRFDFPLSGTSAGEVYGGEAGPDGAKPSDAGALPVYADSAPTGPIEGTLAEARCYFTTGEVGGKHAYCAFMSMRANLPVGVITDKNEFVYVDADSKRLAMLAAKTVRVEGRLSAGGRVMKPEKFYVRKGSAWEEVRESNDR